MSKLNLVERFPNLACKTFKRESIFCSHLKLNYSHIITIDVGTIEDHWYRGNKGYSCNIIVHDIIHDNRHYTSGETKLIGPQALVLALIRDGIIQNKKYKISLNIFSQRHYEVKKLK